MSTDSASPPLLRSVKSRQSYWSVCIIISSSVIRSSKSARRSSISAFGSLYFTARISSAAPAG